MSELTFVNLVCIFVYFVYGWIVSEKLSNWVIFLCITSIFEISNFNISILRWIKIMIDVIHIKWDLKSMFLEFK